MKKSKLCQELFGSRVFLFIAALLLAGCGGALPNPPVKAGLADDREILFASPCKLPCWHGIILGETSKDEFMGMLKETPYSSAPLDEHPIGSGTVVGWRGGAVYLLANRVEI